MSAKIAWLFAFMVLYWGYCLFWGGRCGARAKSAGAFFLADRRLGPWLFVVAATATSFAVPFLALQLGASGFLISVVTDGAVSRDMAMWGLALVLLAYKLELSTAPAQPIPEPAGERRSLRLPRVRPGMSRGTHPLVRYRMRTHCPPARTTLLFLSTIEIVARFERALDALRQSRR